MRVIVAPHAGFCFGVQRAIEIALRAVAEHGKVYCVGPLIHNRQAVEELRRKGLEVVEELDQVPAGAPVMIRTHGAGPRLYEQVARRGHTIIDATCPFVMRAHRAAKEYTEEGYDVVVLGDRDHPEARGLAQHTGGRAVIVEEAAEVDALPLSSRVAVVCQTTQRLDRLQALIAALLPRVQELRVANTICDATAQRQSASAELAQRVDVMIVVGGYHSANTTRLAQICKATGTETYHVETAEELQEGWFDEADTVGVTAGASTPDDAIRAVVQRIVDIGGPGSYVDWPRSADVDQARKEDAPDEDHKL